MVMEVTLRDGTSAFIWPLLHQDRQALRDGFAALSAQSRHDRFLSSVRQLSESMLRVLVDEVDGVDHVALVLTVFPRHEDEQAVAVGRLVRYPDRRHVADVAVTVRDEWQGRGVATALLRALLQQRPPEVTQLFTQVGGDNAASLAMLRRLGPTRLAPAAPGVLDVTVDLPPFHEAGKREPA